MKKITFVIGLLLLIGCSSKPEDTIVSHFLEDVKTLEKTTFANPIITFKEAASKEADKTIEFNRKNIKEMLTLAKEYKHCVITTANHTIVKVIDLDDCKKSGSWSTCMPKGEGYLKKGALVYKQNYINNIIGLADAQERIAYLFY
jgi:hypothetical protein